MARIRSVHPKLCENEEMVDLPAELERTFVRLWTHCDDEGRAKDNPRLIKAAIYPLHDDMTAEVVDGHLRELSRRGHVVRYEVDGVRYLAVPSWSKWQHPQKPRSSDYPPPPDTPTPPVRDTYATPTEPVADESGPVVGVVVVEGKGGERSLDWSRTTDRLLTASATANYRDEAAAIVEGFAVEHGPEVVDAFLEQLLADNRRFPRPSDLRKTLAQRFPSQPKAQPHPLDDTARAARAMAEEGNRQTDELRGIEPDRDLNVSSVRAAREALHQAKSA